MHIYSPMCQNILNGLSSKAFAAAWNRTGLPHKIRTGAVNKAAIFVAIDFFLITSLHMYPFVFRTLAL